MAGTIKLGPGPNMTEFNNMVYPVEITDDVTLHENLTFTSGGIYRIGRLVVIQLRIRCTSEIAPGTNIITGLPAPLMSGTSNNSVAFTIFNMSNSSMQDVYLKSTGTMTTFAATTLAASTNFIITGSYVADS